MAKGLMFVGVVLGVFDRKYILLSNSILCYFAKVAVPQQKLNYTTKKSILPPPDTYSAKEPGNTLPDALPAQSAETGYAQLPKSSSGNIVIPPYFVKRKAATTLLLPGTSSYLTRLLSSQQFPTLQQAFVILKEPTLPILPMNYPLLDKPQDTEMLYLKDLILPDLNSTTFASNPVSNDQAKDLDLHNNSVPLAEANGDAPGTNEIVVTLNEVPPEEAHTVAIPEEEPKKEEPKKEEPKKEEPKKEEPKKEEPKKEEPKKEEPKKETETVVTLNEVASKKVEFPQSTTAAAETQGQNFHNPEPSTIATTDNAEINNRQEFSSEYEITNETVSIVEEIAQPPEAQINSQNAITNPQAEESKLPLESPTEINLPNNSAPEMPAPSNEQVDNVIKELSQEQIDQIVHEAKTRELGVLEKLKTFYSTLKKELENPPQKHDDSHKQKRELIVKNIDNILKDLEKSTNNVNDGISTKRYKTLVTENLCDTQVKLDVINEQRQLRLETLKKLYYSEGAIKINYNSEELDNIEKFVKESGKDIKHIANTRNDDIRRKFFSSIVDHTISFAKYNINWAPAAYNLTWAVADYIIMGIVVDTIAQGAKSISNSYQVGKKISNSIKNISGQENEKQTANLFTRSIATLSGLIGGGATMIIMTPIMMTFTGIKDVLYTPVGIYKQYQSYKIDKDGNTKNWAKSRTQLKSERTLEKNRVHKVKEQKKFAKTVQSQKPVPSNIR